MAVKKTKKLSGQTTTTTVNSGEKFAKVDANGNVTLIDLANLKNALLGGLSLNSMVDGVFIMYHAKSDNYPRMVKPHRWPSLQTGGEVADGVVIVEGGKVLVVAPTESDSTGLLWSSAAMSGGAVTTTNRLNAMEDWAGSANTAAIIAKSTSSAVNNTAAYAPGFCNLYSHGGLGAGKWWLPSAGELMMIYANMTKINYCLSLISGATQILDNWYWSSTEGNEVGAWALNLNSGYLSYSNYKKASAKGRVRPVSAFIN